jgi:hypothetical protein
MKLNQVIVIRPDAPLLKNMSDLEIIEKLRKDLDDIGELSELLKLEEYKHIYAFNPTELTDFLNSGCHSEKNFYHPLFNDNEFTDFYLVPVHEYFGASSRNSFIIVKSPLFLDHMDAKSVNLEVLKLIAESDYSYKFINNNQPIEPKDLLLLDPENQSLELYSEENSHVIYVDFSFSAKVKQLTIAENKTLENMVERFN